MHQPCSPNQTLQACKHRRCQTSPGGAVQRPSEARGSGWRLDRFGILFLIHWSRTIRFHTVPAQTRKNDGTFLSDPGYFLIPRVVSPGEGCRARERGPTEGGGGQKFSGPGGGLGVWAGTGRAEGGAKVQTRSFRGFQAASSKCDV